MTLAADDNRRGTLPSGKLRITGAENVEASLDVSQGNGALILRLEVEAPATVAAIPLHGQVSCTIDWGDGTIEENTEDMSTYYRCILLAGPSEKGQELLSKVNAGEELTWDDLNSATWAVLNPTSASGYIYPSLWLQEHYGKGISDLDNVVECDSHTTSVARQVGKRAGRHRSHGGADRRDRCDGRHLQRHDRVQQDL